MTTLARAHSRDAHYYGDNPDWLIAASVTRESDPLEQSNFASFEAALKALPAVSDWAGEWTPVTTERSSHWAVGWVDYLVIDPACSDAVALAEQMRQRLEDYPVLDEEDLSKREQDEANSVWRDCYNVRERVAYIREHASQFEFRDIADLLGCVRGRYFAGYASELIY